MAPWIQPYALKLAERTGWSMLLLALLPVVLRLRCWRTIPSPRRTSTTSSATCFRPTRCATSAGQSAHPLPQFFETFFVLQEPAYSSIYPVAKAWRWRSAGHFRPPWAGVVLSWRPSARCATGCCVPGPLRVGARGRLAVAESAP